MIKDSKPCFECLARARGFDSAKQILQKLYHNDHLSQGQIARLLGVGRPSVTQRMKHYEIKARLKHQSALLRWRGK